MDHKKKGLVKFPGGIWLPFILLGFLGLAFFICRSEESSPPAFIDFSLSKQEISSRARKICAEAGYNPDGTIVSTVFEERDELSSFLQREYSASQANALMGSEISAFCWSTRFCRAHQDEECMVSLTPDGRLIELNHLIPNERWMPSVSRKEAITLALKFLKDRAALDFCDSKSVDAEPRLVEGIKLIDQGSKKELKRTDHVFIWEDQRHDYSGGRIWARVGVSGNKVSSFLLTLHVPESFDREYADARSYNDLLKSISYVLFTVLQSAMGAVFIWSLSSRRLSLRLVVICGSVSLFVQFLNYWNEWPSILHSYSTSNDFSGFLSSELLSSLTLSLQMAAETAVLVGGIEALYRLKFPRMIALEHLFSLKSLANSSLLQSISAGVCACGIHLGYVVAFYLCGAQLGVWQPLEVRDVRAISSLVPAFSQLETGLSASVEEELLYRVLCFLIGQKLFKNFWIANLFQAAGWAFMHSDYAQEPAYVRGIELTIAGLFLGYIMRRFGVIATIVEHFLYDAFLGASALISSQSSVLVITGCIACAPPFIALALGLLRRASGGESASDEELWNENLAVVSRPQAAQVQAEECQPSFMNLSGKLRPLLILLSLLSASCLVFFEPAKMFDWVQLTASQKEAEQVASRFLRECGVQETGWKMSSQLIESFVPDELQYGFEKLGYRRTEEIARKVCDPVQWWVRFYKQGQFREYWVQLGPDARPGFLRVLEEEEAPGAILSQEQSCRLAEEFLKKYHPELSALKFDIAAEHKFKNRTDWELFYRWPGVEFGDAPLQVDIETQGSLVSYPQIQWKIPDSWLFERDKQTFKDIVAASASALCAAVSFILLCVWGFGLFRSQALHWRPALLAGAVSALLYMSCWLNRLNFQIGQYDTDIPFASYLIQLLVDGLVESISAGAAWALFFALAYSSFRILRPGVGLISMVRLLITPPPERRLEIAHLWRDGVVSAYFLFFCLQLLQLLESNFSCRFSPELQCVSFQKLVNNSHCFSPAFEELITAFNGGVSCLCFAPVAIGIYLRYFRKFGRWFMLSVLYSLIFQSSARNWQDYLICSVQSTLQLSVVYFWFRYCALDNPLAYFIAGVLLFLGGSVLSLLKTGSQVYAADLAVCAISFLLPLFMPFVFAAGERVQKSLAVKGSSDKNGDSGGTQSD